MIEIYYFSSQHVSSPHENVRRIERRHNICGLRDKYTVSYKHVNRRERSTKRSR